MNAGPSPPVLQPPAPPVMRRTPSRSPFPKWLLVLFAVAVAAMVGAMAFKALRSYQYPPGFRNRPSTGWGTRPGEHEFSAADDQLDSFNGTNAFGNSPAAVKLAQQFSETFKSMRDKLFTKDLPIDIFDRAKGQFMTYCELHDQECAFVVHVPELRHYDKDMFEKVDARKLLSETAWASAQRVLKENAAGKQQMELAVGLRGISEYGPIMIGYYKGDLATPDDGVIKYLDEGAQTHFLWPFFAPPAGKTAPAK